MNPMNIENIQLKYTSPASISSIEQLIKNNITIHTRPTYAELKEIISEELIKSLYEPCNTTWEEVERKIEIMEVELNERNKAEIEEMKILFNQGKLDIEEPIETKDSSDTKEENVEEQKTITTNNKTKKK